METIGDRIRYWRQRRGGISQQVLADRVGVTRNYVSMVEAGKRSVDRRSTLAAFAEALQVRVEELTGASEPGDPVRERAAAPVPAIRRALILREAGEVEDPPPGGLARAWRLHAAADHAALAPILPGLLSGARGPDLVGACLMTVFCCRALGEPDLARDAARLATATAGGLGDPVLAGVAAFARTHAYPADTARLAARDAAASADALQPALGQGRPVRDLHGMLHLTAALWLAAAGQPSDVDRHLDEAAAHAAELGEPDGPGYACLAFGPTNVRVWRALVATELGDPDRALAAIDGVEVRVLPTPRRRAAAHVEHGRALAALGRDDDATIEFLRAEQESPLLVRFDPVVRDAVAAIRVRTRDAAVSRPLRRLCTALDLR